MYHAGASASAGLARFGFLILGMGLVQTVDLAATGCFLETIAAVGVGGFGARFLITRLRTQSKSLSGVRRRVRGRVPLARPLATRRHQWREVRKTDQRVLRGRARRLKFAGVAATHHRKQRVQSARQCECHARFGAVRHQVGRQATANVPQRRRAGPQQLHDRPHRAHTAQRQLHIFATEADVGQRRRCRAPQVDRVLLVHRVRKVREQAVGVANLRPAQRAPVRDVADREQEACRVLGSLLRILSPRWPLFDGRSQHVQATLRDERVAQRVGAANVRERERHPRALRPRRASPGQQIDERRDRAITGDKRREIGAAGARHMADALRRAQPKAQPVGDAQAKLLLVDDPSRELTGDGDVVGDAVLVLRLLASDQRQQPHGIVHLLMVTGLPVVKGDLREGAHGVHGIQDEVHGFRAPRVPGSGHLVEDADRR